MLLDAAGNFLTQRNLPEMALLQTAIDGDRLRVTHRTPDGKLCVSRAGEYRNLREGAKFRYLIPAGDWEDLIRARCRRAGTLPGPPE